MGGRKKRSGIEREEEGKRGRSKVVVSEQEKFDERPSGAATHTHAHIRIHATEHTQIPRRDRREKDWLICVAVVPHTYG